jgi:5-deoxy-glucuronate isomerase
LLESEHRGKGQLNDTAYRIVRTIFDIRNRPTTKLVLGEVINFPGRWSSYPPHHHSQPEIYHYRFTKPQGYGHGELGEEVLRLKQNDTVKILNEKDHSQTAAPGYGMYYIWVIRHLKDNNYTVPEFTEAHQWLLKKDADIWQPSI